MCGVVEVAIFTGPPTLMRALSLGNSSMTSSTSMSMKLFRTNPRLPSSLCSQSKTTFGRSKVVKNGSLSKMSPDSGLALFDGVNESSRLKVPSFADMKLRRQAKSLFTDVRCRLWAVGMVRLVGMDGLRDFDCGTQVKSGALERGQPDPRQRHADMAPGCGDVSNVGGFRREGDAS